MFLFLVFFSYLTDSLFFSLNISFHFFTFSFSLSLPEEALAASPHSTDTE